MAPIRTNKIIRHPDQRTETSSTTDFKTNNHQNQLLTKLIIDRILTSDTQSQEFKEWELNFADEIIEALASYAEESGYMDEIGPQSITNNSTETGEAVPAVIDLTKEPDTVCTSTQKPIDQWSKGTEKLPVSEDYLDSRLIVPVSVPHVRRTTHISCTANPTDFLRATAEQPATMTATSDTDLLARRQIAPVPVPESVTVTEYNVPRTEIFFLSVSFFFSHFHGV